MWRKTFLAVCALGCTGCAVTDRLDLVNQHLSVANSQLSTADQRLAEMQANVRDLHAQMNVALRSLEETNRKLNTVEQAVLQSPVLRPKISPPPPIRPIPPPAASAPSR